jgi:asparagine synthase (glutamine-hydrolysing)
VDEACETLAGLYRSAVRRQLVSDVPLGLLLSGGVDSSLLLALMREYGKDWLTFSAGYGKEFRDDELDEAGETARYFGVPNIRVELNQSAFESSLRGVIAALEEPVATSSIVPMYHLCRTARQHVKVALMGQGPDELLGGYVRHLGVAYGKYWRCIPGPARQAATRLLTRISPRSEAVRRGAYALGADDRFERYRRVLSMASDAMVRTLFHPDCLADLRSPECWCDLKPIIRPVDELGGLQALEIRSTLPDELLMYADKLSMAHGLEVRVPYLDQDVVDYVERLPARLKLRFGSRKWLHRRVAASVLPTCILRRRKRGFACTVVDSWFRRSLFTTAEKLLRDRTSRIYQHLDVGAVTGLLADHAGGKSDHHKLLFSLVVLEELLRSVRTR